MPCFPLCHCTAQAWCAWHMCSALRDLGRLLLAHSRDAPATAFEARDVELEVLMMLRWRLGPFL